MKDNGMTATRHGRSPIGQEADVGKISTDAAIAQAWARVPVDRAADHLVCEIRLQFSHDHCNAVLSRDTFAQDPEVTDFYGTGRTPAEAIMNAISSYETSPLHREAIGERPGRAAVTPHPVAPNTQEEGSP